MKVTKNDLISSGLFDKLPDTLKNMGAGDYFVFYYDVDEENIRLKIYETTIVKQVNVSLFRGLRDKAIKLKLKAKPSIGFFSDTFETRDGLFYQFLRTYNDNEAVASFYSVIIEMDRFNDVNISTGGAVTDIYNSDDFRRGMSYFSRTRIQPVMFVYDMVNNVFKNKLSKNLYGDCIKKVVNLVKFEGGVLPEINGTLRFMVIGENAVLSQEQAEKLREAKVLVRSLVTLDKIYQFTGWVFSEKDGKWRTNIADNEARLNPALLYTFNEGKIYRPKGMALNEVLELLKQPDKMYGYNYNGVLSEVLTHPTLYQYYPQLATLPLLYCYTGIGNASTFYFSPNTRGGYIIIDGNKNCGESLSILLHETQHSIQNIENFATGGNLFLAKFVASVGGASVRKIFASMNKMERYFRDFLMDEQNRLELIRLVQSEFVKSADSAGLKKMLLDILNNKDDYSINYKTINFYLILFVAENDDYTTSGITIFLQDKFGDIVFDLFENISEGYKSAKNYQQKLSSEGFRNEDIGTILFSSYENLYGEIESRSVQSSRLVEGQYKNYFYLTKWERSPIEQISVIDGIEEVIDCTKINAAVENKGGFFGEYVLHFERGMSCVPFLHELGHIVHDALNVLGYKEKIEKAFEYSKTIIHTDVDEFFVSRFLGYLKDNVDDEFLQRDLSADFSIDSEKSINAILDEFFADSNSDSRLNYLQTMLSV